MLHLNPTKRCTKCNEDKPFAEFPKDRSKPSGLYPSCKTCHRLREQCFRRTPEGKLSKKIGRIKYRQQPQARELMRQASQRAYQANKKKWLARTALAGMVRRGKIHRPNACSDCGVNCKPEGHHENYDFRFDVRWLCKTCHEKIHHQMKEAC